MRRLLPAVAVLLLLPAAARAAEVRSGALTATIQADPWKVSFAGPAGTGVAERAGSGLGFETSLGWFRATRVVSETMDGAAYTATVATSDPAGTTFAVRIAPDADGVIALSATVSGGLGGVQRTGMGFEAPSGERYLGFGERNVAVDHRGRQVENFVSDGPYQSEERPVVSLLVPQPGFRFRDDATYFPIPWLLSTGGYGVLIDRDETSTFELGTESDDTWSLEVESAALALRVFAGPRPRDVLRRFTAQVGRQPKAAAPFFFGPWWQPTGGDSPALEKLQAAGAAGSLVNTYTHYLPCGDQTGKEQAQTERTALFHDAGLAITAYFNPMICTGHPRYGEAVAAGVLTRNSQGQPYEYRYQGSTNFSVAQFDFTAPGADPFYASLLGEAVGHGYDGWMEDFGEYTPPDSVAADGTPGPAMHNRYVMLYHRSARRYTEQAPRPLARFNRSGWTGAAQYSQIVWGGDPTTDWGFDGLTSAVRQGLSMGLSGVSLWGSDVGGYFALGSRSLSPELLRRWIEFGFASGVMRTEANGFDLPEHGDRPQIWDDDVLPVWRRYARLRTQLYPYLAAAEGQYDRSGLPLMRQLALRWPRDARATARDDEYLLGDSLLVAPVLGPGQTERALYLPAGRWVDLWRSAALTPAATLRLGAASVLEGARDVTVPAPADELPLFVRTGAVLPLLPAAVDTLAGYGKAPGLVHLRDRGRARVLLAFPRGTTRSLLGPGESVRSAESAGGWTLTLRAKRPRTYRLQASLATLRTPFVPCAVSGRGRWSYDRAAHVLRGSFRLGRNGRLVVRACRD
jgi:alpha-glucosidase (family GH31 glycosyl hydrolase)